MSHFLYTSIYICTINASLLTRSYKTNYMLCASVETKGSAVSLECMNRRKTNIKYFHKKNLKSRAERKQSQNINHFSPIKFVAAYAWRWCPLILHFLHSLPNHSSSSKGLKYFPSMRYVPMVRRTAHTSLGFLDTILQKSYLNKNVIICSVHHIHTLM